MSKKKPIKICGCCGKEHFEMPSTARHGHYGEHYWECSCQSTMTYIPERELTRRLIKESAINSRKNAV
jgi:hypothetical protein